MAGRGTGFVNLTGCSIGSKECRFFSTRANRDHNSGKAFFVAGSKGGEVLVSRSVGCRTIIRVAGLGGSVFACGEVKGSTGNGSMRMFIRRVPCGRGRLSFASPGGRLSTIAKSVIGSVSKSGVLNDAL